MKKAYSYILKSYIGPFIITFFIALFILLMQFLWKYVDDMVGKGFDWHIIARLLFYASSTFVPMALPLAVLLSSLMAFGNLGERYELVAFKSAGISIRSIMRPMVFFIFFLGIITFIFSNNVMPVANLKMRLLLHDVRQQKPAVSIQPGIFYDEIDNYTIKIDRRQDDGRTIEGVVIYDHSRQQGNVNVTVADSGTMQVTEDKRYLIFQLFNGINYYERIETREQKYSRPLQVTRFHEQTRRIDLSAFSFQRTQEDFYKDHYGMMNLNQLQRSRDSLLEDTRERKVRLQQRHWDQLRYYKSLEKEKTAKEQADSAITYAALSSIFSGHIPGHDIQEKLRERRSRIQPDSQSQPPEEQSQQGATADHHQAPEEMPHTAESSPNIRGFTMDELSHFAARHDLDLDSLIARAPGFPTLIHGNTILDYNLPENFKSDERQKITNLAVNSVRNILNNVEHTRELLNRRKQLIARHEIEWHRKFTLSFACIVLFFIGAPLGAIIRKGGFGFPVVVSVLLFVVYHVISITGEKFARELVVSPWWGMWMSAFALLPLGLFLTIKATTDAPLMNTDTWKKSFRNIRSRIGKGTKI